MKTITLACAFAFISTLISAQFCNSTVYFTLGPLGEGEITTDVLYNGAPGYTPLYVYPNMVTCDNIGIFTAVLVALDSNGDTVECVSVLTIEDKTPPVAICDQDVTIQLDPAGILTLDPAWIDDGSYDLCSAVSLSVEPQIVQCGDPNPVQVVLTASDQYGNTNSCICNVYYSAPPGLPALACNDDVVIQIFNDEPVEVTVQMILATTVICYESYSLTLSLNGNPLPTNIVGPELIGQPVITKVTELSSGNMCWGSLTIQSSDCPLAVFCDTECHTAPVGTCNDGHTLDDNVEWPCDIEINEWFDIQSNYPTPEYLVDHGYASVADASPQLTGLPCHLFASTRADIVFTEPDGYTIQRTWTVIEWHNFIVGEYVQIISININPLIVCDTLPWNTPAADCESGHTFLDAVEWPADDTTYSTLVLPAFLASDPDINPNNVQPVVQNDSVPTLLTYTDVVSISSDTSASVMRTWTLTDVLANLSWSYTQELTILADLTSATACAYRENGDVIPDVIMSTGFATDATGCVTLDVMPGDVITPSKTGDLQEGVDIVDVVLLMEHVLGITVLSPYQLLAADVNHNGYVSTVDVVLLQDLIAGEYTTSPVWEFYDASFQFADPLNPFASPPPSSIVVGNLNLGYNFIGVKTGDLDLSYDLSDLQPTTTIDFFMMDEILNNGESYSVEMTSDKILAVQGLQLELDASSPKFQINSVTSSVLPGFDPENHVSFEGDKIIIRYVVPFEIMQTGILRINPGEPILTLNLTANANGILSDELHLVDNNDQYLKINTISEKIGIRLHWDNEIASRLKNTALLGVSIFPNPATDQISIVSDDQAGLSYRITDLQGRLVLSGAWGTGGLQSLDVSSLSDGVYLLLLNDREMRFKADKLIIQR